MNRFVALFKRDFENCMSKRFFFLLGFMVLFQFWFIIGSGSVEKVIESGKMDYMAIVFSFNIFGSLAVLALTFDNISKERQNKVMDLLLTSGIQKKTVVLSKTAVNMIVSLIFSAMYIAAIGVIYLVMSGSIQIMLQCLPYLFPLAAFNFIYCMLGLMLSILFRSSKVSLIVTVIIGLLCMPRLLVSVLEGVAGAFGLGAGFVETAGMVSPALIMNALSGASDLSNAMIGLGLFVFYIALLLLLSMKIFGRQDELNYGE